MTATWVWSGAAGPAGFKVKAKVTGTSQRLAVSTSAAMTSPTFFGPVSPVSGIATLTATGLAADTQYWYEIEDNGVLDTTKLGKAHTHAAVGTPYTFTFAAWACAGSSPVYPATTGMAPNRISNHPGYSDIRLANPLFAINMGDLSYYDPGSPTHVVSPPTAAVWQDMYDTVLTTSNQGRLYREVPTVYVWDNHCYGQMVSGQDDTSDGTFPQKSTAAQVYRDRVPSYPLVLGSGSIYHSFQVGRVLFVVTDERFNRDATTHSAPRTMLGSAQLTWLDGLLGTAAADPNVKALCWVSEQPSSSGGSSSWGVFPEERAQLYAMFDAHGWTSRMFQIAGDQHQLGFDTGSHTNGHPLYTLASMDSSSGGATGGYDIGTFVDNSNRGQYGLITIEDNGSTFIRWTAKGFSYSV